MRKFCADDAEFLEEARRRDFPDGWKREMILSSLKGETFGGLIEEENGKTIAAITFDKAADSADIECVYVLPEKRKNAEYFVLEFPLCEAPKPFREHF